MWVLHTAFHKSSLCNELVANVISVIPFNNALSFTISYTFCGTEVYFEVCLNLFAIEYCVKIIQTTFFVDISKLILNITTESFEIWLLLFIINIFIVG